MGPSLGQVTRQSLADWNGKSSTGILVAPAVPGYSINVVIAGSLLGVHFWLEPSTPAQVYSFTPPDPFCTIDRQCAPAALFGAKDFPTSGIGCLVIIVCSLASLCKGNPL